MMRHVEDWTKTSIGSVAMGHEVSTTSLQLAVAGAVIANGGMLVKPTIVLSRQKPGQATERFVSEKPRPTIRPETAITMRRFMEGVVLRGTGKGLANLRGYTSGGKTGTAQVYDSRAHAYTHRYNASFLGFAPVVNPQIVVAVTLNNTAGGIEGYGGPVAAPVFREVAMSALRMLDVPKDLPDSAVVAAAEPADHNDLAIAGLGDGADGLNLPAGSSVTSPPVPDDALHSSVASDRDRRSLEKSDRPEADAPRLLNAAVSDSRASGPKVPNLLGMTLRAVLEESSANGLEVETLGSPETGLVRSQEPPPGAILRPGTRVRVQFAK